MNSENVFADVGVARGFCAAASPTSMETPIPIHSVLKVVDEARPHFPHATPTTAAFMISERKECIRLKSETPLEHSLPIMNSENVFAGVGVARGFCAAASPTSMETPIPIHNVLKVVGKARPHFPHATPITAAVMISQRKECISVKSEKPAGTQPPNHEF